MKASGAVGKLAAMFALALAACQGTPVYMESGSAPNQGTRKGERVVAESCGYQLFSFIPIRQQNRTVRAYEKLRVRADRRVLTDIEVEERWVWIVVGTLYCTRMQAVAYARS